MTPHRFPCRQWSCCKLWCPLGIWERCCSHEEAISARMLFQKPLWMLWQGDFTARLNIQEEYITLWRFSRGTEWAPKSIRFFWHRFWIMQFPEKSWEEDTVRYSLNSWTSLQQEGEPHLFQISEGAIGSTGIIFYHNTVTQELDWLRGKSPELKSQLWHWSGDQCYKLHQWEVF